MHKKDLAVFFDFDSTVITKEGLDSVIEHALSEAPELEQKRILAEVDTITNLGMEGKLDFCESVRRRLTAAALTRTQFETVGTDLTQHITPGMQELFSWLEARTVPTYIVSGGFYELIYPTAQVLGVPKENCVANQCIYDANGAVTGIDESSPTWTNEGKTFALTYLIERDKIIGIKIMIGDGANDLKAYERGIADTFICFTQNVHRNSVADRSPHNAKHTHTVQKIINKMTI